MGSIIKICLKLVVLSLLIIQSVSAAEISSVCSFYDNENTKFSTHLNQGRSDNSFGYYSSGLDIADNGADLDGWQPVWCYSRSAEKVRTDHTADGGSDDYGFFNFRIDSVNGQSTELALTNTTDSSQKMQFVICMGQKSGTLSGNCNSSFAKFASIPLSTIPRIDSFNQAMLPVEDNWKNPATFIRHNWRVASHLHIPKGGNATLAPGIYRGLVSLTLQVKFQGIVTGSFNTAIDGFKSFQSYYNVYIQKDCQLDKSIDPIIFEEASFVKNMQPKRGFFNVRCTLNTPYTIKMRGKNDVGSDHNQHYLVSDLDNSIKIPYSLYQSNGNTIWDYNTPLQQQGTGLTEQKEIVAKVNPNSAEVPAGHYQDTIYIELDY